MIMSVKESQAYDDDDGGGGDGDRGSGDDDGGCNSTLRAERFQGHSAIS